MSPVTLGYWVERKVIIANGEAPCSNARVRGCRACRDYTFKNEPHQGSPSIPSISLKGTWLEQAGFTIECPIFGVVSNHFLATSE